MSGKAIILCAPSGSGKTTLAKFLLSNKDLNLKFSVSATTREIRKNETNYIDYNFLDVKTFKNKISNGEFIEFEEVYTDIFYGTLKSEVKKMIKNHNLIFDVDVVGATSLKKYFSKNSISIFINPPSIGELEKRLIDRGMKFDIINERIAKAKYEISMEDKFDFSVINDDLDLAKKEILDLVKTFLNN